jgi:uncharacterized cofD-like protein
VILPSTLQNVEICAQFSDGSEMCGESAIPEVRKPIERVYLRPEHPAAQPEAVSAILEADLIVLGPGSLYTSVLPNLLVEGIAKALMQADGLKVYVCNVATQPGETDGYNVQRHVDALVRHLPGDGNPIDVVVATRHPDLTASLEVGVTLVTTAPSRSTHPRVMVEDVVRDDLPLRHDPDKLATVLMRLYEEVRSQKSEVRSQKLADG